MQMAGTARNITAIDKLQRTLDIIKKWAKMRGLTFSKNKTQNMSKKGGLKPGYQMRFGTGAPDELITSESPVRYLGIHVDYKRTYWDQVRLLADNSMDLFSRLRGMMSANWGLSQLTARKIYHGVYLPRLVW